MRGRVTNVRNDCRVPLRNALGRTRRARGELIEKDVIGRGGHIDLGARLVGAAARE